MKCNICDCEIEQIRVELLNSDICSTCAKNHNVKRVNAFNIDDFDDNGVYKELIHEN